MKLENSFLLACVLSEFDFSLFAFFVVVGVAAFTAAESSCFNFFRMRRGEACKTTHFLSISLIVLLGLEINPVPLLVVVNDSIKLSCGNISRQMVVLLLRSGAKLLMSQACGVYVWSFQKIDF